MNALVPQTRTELAQYGATDPFSGAAEEMGGTNAQYLKFNGNTGQYSYGAQAEELPHGTLLAADVANMKRGWICWKDGEVKDEIMIRVIDGRPPVESDLPDHGPYVKTADQNDGWSEQSSINLRDVNTGEMFTFKVSSKSALRSLGTVLKNYGNNYKSKPGQLPVVELGASSFTPRNKTWGKKYAPVLIIKDWRLEADLLASVGDSEADYEQPTEEAEAAEPEVQAQPVKEATPAPTAEKPKPATAAKAAPAAAPAAGGGPRRRSF